MVFDVSSTSQIAYVTITIISDDSTNPCLFKQCTSDINDLTYVTGVSISIWQRPESKIQGFMQDNIIASHTCVGGHVGELLSQFTNF